MSVKTDIGKFLTNYFTLANPLSSIFANTEADLNKAPTQSLRISDNPKLNYALWNTLGTMSWLVPLIGTSAYIANKRRHDRLKEKIDKGTVSHINSDFPILSPYSDLGSALLAKKRPKREVENINKASKNLPKQLSKEAGDPSDIGEIVRRSIYGAIPILATPLAAILTTKGVQSHLKDKYKKELEEETRKIQQIQDAVDMDTLKRLGYIVKDDSKKAEEAVPVKKLESKEMSNIMEQLSAMPKAASKKEENRSVTEDVKSAATTLLANLPMAALLLFTGGTAIYGTDWLLKRQNDAKKLRFLEEKALGRNRALRGPELIVELPPGYKENLNKKQSQIIPGIEAAPVVEDAEIVENSKKDAFLG